MTDRDQSPHYIPELDPEHNNSDGGASGLKRMTAIETVAYGLIVALAGFFLEISIALKIGIGAVIIGVVLLVIVGHGQNTREERN